MGFNPKNAELSVKLGKIFAARYDFANNEKDKNCVVLAIHITKATVIKVVGLGHLSVTTDCDRIHICGVVCSIGVFLIHRFI